MSFQDPEGKIVVQCNFHQNLSEFWPLFFSDPVTFASSQHFNFKVLYCTGSLCISFFFFFIGALFFIYLFIFLDKILLLNLLSVF